MKTIHIVLFGIGNVGSTLIKQIENTQQHLANRQIKINIPVITNSHLAFFKDDGIASSWQTDFEAFSVPYKIQDIIRCIKKKEFKNLIAIDATASSKFIESYIPLIQNGFHIVSANKIANTLHYEFYRNLRLTLKKYNKQFLYETNVGGGLPIIETIKSLYDSGENIRTIKGVFSGSLSYIFNTFSSNDIAFSKVLNSATVLGLTEPDARVDLSGIDVARKLLILARELDLKLELKDVNLESLVPKQLNGKTTLAQFNAQKQQLDIPFNNKKAKQTKGEVFRHVAELDVNNKKLEVKLVTVKKESTLGQLNGTDNVFEIFTDTYKQQPIVIKGSGAGKEVTARGLLSDVLKVANNLN